MRRLLLSLLVIAAPAAVAQAVYDSVDEMPELVGGLGALQEIIEYPASARAEGTGGQVLVQFVVDEQGRAVDAEILRGAHPDLDAAALAAVDQAQFVPGRLDDAPVRVRMILPITFVQPEETVTKAEVASHVDEMPRMIGGMAAFLDRLVYPEAAKREGLEGRLILAFVVTEEGVVESIEVIQGVAPLLDETARKALQATRFVPGKHDGEPVRVRMALPVNFELPG